MTIIKKDILTVERGIICQQVNCMGVMGSGVAKSIRDKWPIVFDEYQKFCSCAPKHEETRKLFRPALLGEILLTEVASGLRVCNIFSQYDFNRRGEVFKKHTEYGAFYLGLEQLKRVIALSGGNTPVYFPWKIGADRGGGDWKIMEEIIDFYFPDAIVCQL
jgi:hypothetical protein